MNFVFAGNRSHVLQSMLNRGLEVRNIFTVEGSYLHRWLLELGRPHSLLPPRNDFIRQLQSLDFDCFVSCGCPIILPVSKFSSNKTFVNIHPSLLPNLRGVDPVPGAILFDCPAGVTCHQMDDGIDTGPLISQVPISRGPDIDDVDMLYRISFRAEVEAFQIALDRGFQVDSALVARQEAPIVPYYTYQKSDAVLQPKDDLATAYRRLQAFSTRSKGVVMTFDNGSVLRAFGGAVLKNSSVHAIYANVRDNAVADAWDETVILRKSDGFLRIRVKGELPKLGSILVLGSSPASMNA